MALSRVREDSDFVIEESVFHDVFPKLIPTRVIERLNDGYRRQGRFDKVIPLALKQKSGEKKQSAASNKIKRLPSPAVSMPVSSSEVQEPPPYGDEDPFTDPPPPYSFADDGTSHQPFEIPDDDMVDSSLLDSLTLAQAVFMLPSRIFLLDTQCGTVNHKLFKDLLDQQPPDSVAQAIGQFPFNGFVDGNRRLHLIPRIWHGLDFYVSFNVLYPFLASSWLHGSSILVAVSALATPAAAIQLLHPDLFGLVGTKVLRGPTSDYEVGSIIIFSIIITVVIPVNLESHWLLLFVTRQGASLVVIEYNSSSGLGGSRLSKFRGCIRASFAIAFGLFSRRRISWTH